MKEDRLIQVQQIPLRGAALKWTGDPRQVNLLQQWLGYTEVEADLDYSPPRVRIKRHTGPDLQPQVGQWIVKLVHSPVQILGPAEFELRYEESK
jgi:hypothetical protein